MSVEGYGDFNVCNNTDLHNYKQASDLTKNVLNHFRKIDRPTGDLSFPPIDDWNVLNNLVEQFIDRAGYSDKEAFRASKEKGKLHPERRKTKSGSIPVVDRGSIRGNLTGKNVLKVFVNSNLDGLNLIPADPSVKNGVSPSEELAAQGVTQLDSFRGAYDVGSTYWYPGSDWMPYGLPVLKTMAEAQQFAEKYRTVSLAPTIPVRDLPSGRLGPN